MSLKTLGRAMLKRSIPAPARRVIREALADRRLDIAIKALREYGRFTDTELYEFWSAWGNEGFSADRRYLAEVIRLIALHPGDVLECGTGATTLIAGVLAERYGFKVYSLEQDPLWSRRTKRAVQRNRLTQVEILNTPLTAFGDYMWYDTGAVSLPKRLGVVICDGPYIAEERGEPIYSSWRYGVLKYLSDSGSAYGTILLDDANDRRASDVLRRWREDFGVSMETIRSKDGDFSLIAPLPLVAR